MIDVSAAVAAYSEMTGRSPDGLWSSPGRVNLMGDHTDYSEGLALPLAIDRTAVVAAGLRADSVLRCASRQMPAPAVVALADLGPGVDAGWAAPLLGALWGLRRAGVALPGVDLVVDSDIPPGGGLASSAAVAVAAALAVTELTGQQMAHNDIARCCRDGEAAIAGAPTGLLDQLAVLAARAGHVVSLDCRSLERELVAFRPIDVSAAVLAIDTSVAHSNSAAGYRSRREQSAQAATALGVPTLRDATAEAVERDLDGVLQRRARHVVTENARVRRAVALLRQGQLHAIGAVLVESHASLRDDYEASSSELDTAVDAACEAGAWGARLTGAGWGGCAIALVPLYAREAVAEAVHAAFARQGFRAPTVFEVSASDGAARRG
ncbi:MAG TPA: galactokinase [Candidatus Dormibacteraeota bacterium]|nr:galactokinase [Candidatus Dormibacteraeota bacterium]